MWHDFCPDRGQLEATYLWVHGHLLGKQATAGMGQKMGATAVLNE